MAPKLRFWQSRKRTLKTAETGFDVLKVLARSKRPLSVSDILEIMGYSRNSLVQSGYVANALLALHKAGAVTSETEVSRVRLAGDLTKVSITAHGRQLAKESRTRAELARRMLEES